MKHRISRIGFAGLIAGLLVAWLSPVMASGDVVVIDPQTGTATTQAVVTRMLSADRRYAGCSVCGRQAPTPVRR